jgi:L-threonylcarbamoyladenylate synthase
MIEVSLQSAAATIRTGRCVVVPTDTVYGLAASPEKKTAVRQIFDLKGRPQDKALPVLGDSLEALDHVAEFTEDARSVAEGFWPGPLTLVLRRADGFDHDLGGPDDGTIAVRVPGDPALRSLLAETGALAVTSANRSGESPAHTAEEARDIFPGVPVVDGGSRDGRPSTVLSLLGAPKILREGSVDLSQIRAAITG